MYLDIYIIYPSIHLPPNTLALPPVECADFCAMCDVPGKCLPDKCEAGYRYDNATELCRQCADGCHTCVTTGAAKCDMDSCWPGFAYMDMRCTGEDSYNVFMPLV